MMSAQCLVCNAPMTPVLDLGEQPFANALTGKPQPNPARHPLGLGFCRSCTHAQLTYFADPAELFSHYTYASGTSRTLNEFFGRFALFLRQIEGKNRAEKPRCLEIACNDGSLMRKLEEQGFEVKGVDPAANVVADARANGLDIVEGFFPAQAPAGQFNYIIAMNVLAHTPDPRAMLQGVKNKLTADGLAFIQTSQAMMLPGGEFDTIYHEHYSFFTVASMRKLAESCGLRLAKVKLVSVHGGSFVFVLQHADARKRDFDTALIEGFEINPDGVDLPFTGDIIAEDSCEKTYRSFALQAAGVIDNFRAQVKIFQDKGFNIAVVGVAAKVLTLLQAAEVAADAFLDEAPLKIGTYVAGSSSPIQPLAHVRDLPKNTLYIIGAWNFSEELISKLKALHPGTLNFMIVFPTLRILER